MCGFLLTCNLKTNLTNFNSALKIINHRGPDFSFTHYDPYNNIYIGHNRLSIIDIEAGNQPFWSEDKKTCIIYNGEIYNFKILRSQLIEKGINFKSNSDTEVILNVYKFLGSGSFDLLEGMFAFVIIDFEKGNIIFSRDYYGKKPIYFYFKNNVLIISSELRPIIILLKKNVTISNKNFESFLSNGYYSSNKTIYSEVLKQDKNSFISYNFKEKKFIKKNNIYAKELKKNIKSIDFKKNLFDSVEKRLIADKEVGCFLSGGIDSTIVSIIASSINPNIKTFSIFFDDKKYDESKNINYITKKYGLKNYSLRVDDKIISENLNEIFDISEPICDSSIIPTYILSKFTKSHVDVALSGDGADELFYGYNVFDALYLSFYFNKFKISKIINYLFNEKYYSEGNSYFNFLFILKKFLNGLRVPDNNRLNEFLRPIYRHQINNLINIKDDINVSDKKKFHNSNEYMKFNRSLIIDNYLNYNILAKCDLASMKASLELRSPFLDLSLIDQEYSLSKYKFNYKKNFFRKHLNEIVDKDIINQKKHGFAVPNNLIFNKNNIDYFYSLENRFNLNTKYLKDLFKLNLDNKINLKNFFWGFIHLNKIIDKDLYN